MDIDGGTARRQRQRRRARESRGTGRVVTRSLSLARSLVRSITALLPTFQREDRRSHFEPSLEEEEEGDEAEFGLNLHIECRSLRWKRCAPARRRNAGRQGRKGQNRAETEERTCT